MKTDQRPSKLAPVNKHLVKAKCPFRTVLKNKERKAPSLTFKTKLHNMFRL